MEEEIRARTPSPPGGQDAFRWWRACPGGCHCGRIRFTAAGVSDYPRTCSCPDCQKRGGCPMMSWVAFPLDGFTWTGEGEPTWYDTFPGETRRGFCPDCGSHIAAFDHGDTWMGVNLPALDNPRRPRARPGQPVLPRHRGDPAAPSPRHAAHLRRLTPRRRGP
ncbi:GFA family protein [Streptomyces sp. NPDC020965]|uniref:GFA family protein n=1 Tax=Streptomyces sp. NPDC020965 TaxID=3365105 RepID=UPI00378AB7F8